MCACRPRRPGESVDDFAWSSLVFRDGCAGASIDRVRVGSSSSPARFSSTPESRARIPAPNPSPPQEILLHPRTHPFRRKAMALPKCNLAPNCYRKSTFFIGFDTNFLLQKLSILRIFLYQKIFSLGGNRGSPLGHYCDSPLPKGDFPIANCDSRTPNRFPQGISRFA